MMKFSSIKYKLLVAFAAFLLAVTLLNAGLTSYLIDRRGEAESFSQLSRQLILFQNDLQGWREAQLVVAMEAATDEKNLSDMAILYNQTLKLAKEPGDALDSALSLNKITSLNRLQLILLSARLSGAAVYLGGDLSHYVTPGEAGMTARRGGRPVVVGTRQDEGEKVQLAEWRNWSEEPLPVVVAPQVPVVDRVTVAFDFPAAQMMVLRVVVPIQGVPRESFNETIAENLTIATPETLRQPQTGGKAPVVIGQFVFSKIFDMTFLEEVAAETGLLPAILSADGQHRVQLAELGAPAAPQPSQHDPPIRLQTVNVGTDSYYQAFLPWQIQEGGDSLILSLALSRENTLGTIRQTVAGIIAAAVLILAVGGAIGYGLIARLIAPLKALTTVVSGIELKNTDAAEHATGEQALQAALGRYLDQPIAPQSNDEIGKLTRAFNSMARHLRQLIGNLEQRMDELRQTEEILRESEEKYRSLIQKAQTAILLHDSEGRILAGNPMAQRLLGLSEDQLLGRDLIDPQWHFLREDGSVMPVAEYPVSLVLASRQPLKDYVAGIHQPDHDEAIWVLVNAEPEFDDAGEIAQIIVSFIDLTGRKQAEEALRDSERRLAEAQRTAHIGNWELNLINNALTWSDEIFRIFEIDPKKFSATYEAFLNAIHPDDREAVNFAYTNSLKTKTPYAIDHRLLFADGRIKYVHEQCETFYEGDNPIRSIGTVQDITERKLAEEEIRRLNAELEQRVFDRTAQLEAANKELEAFAYSVSHDLRAPLRHVDGFLELLQKRIDGTLDERSRHYMSNIADSAKQMGQLIDDLLDFSRMGRNEMSKTPVDLAALVQDVIRELAPEMQDRTIRWNIADLPTVSGDQAMLRQVLVNLLANALKFTQGCTPADIEIGCQMGEKETTLFIRDNGVGFDMTYADKLFGVFQRLHRADEFEGTGIGLANVRRIISRHGGRTWAEGQVNQGATFYFSLSR